MTLAARLIIWLATGVPLLVEWADRRRRRQAEWPEAAGAEVADDDPTPVAHAHEWNEPADQPPLQLVHYHPGGQRGHDHDPAELEELAAEARAEQGRGAGR